LDKALAALKASQTEIGFEDIKSDSNVTKVSVVGIGMRSHTGVAQTMFEALADRNINVEVIATSEIKLIILAARSVKSTRRLRGRLCSSGSDQFHVDLWYSDKI